MPAAYPPRATRDGAVLIEIELDGTGAALTHRVMSPASPFDAPALEAVRTWRLAPPAKPSRAEKLYVYAIVGFKEPITQ
jgi:TonB family protein